MNAVFLSLMSACYAFLFILTSDHLEFSRLLSKSNTLQSGFWNGWSGFIRAGSMKYVGYGIIALTAVILVLMLLKRTKSYDEFQMSILSKSLIIAGILSIVMLPVLMVMLLSDTNYTVETIFLFGTVQWFSILFAELFYVVRYAGYPQGSGIKRRG